MNKSRIPKLAAVIISSVMFTIVAGGTFAQGQSDKKAAKKEMKQVNKEANKLANKADEAAAELGRKVLFCILAAHTSGVGTAQELKDKFDALADFQFGQFVAAVLLADQTDLPLDDIIAKLIAGMSIGQIIKEAGVNMGEVRDHFGEFRSELARSMTNPPTKNCFSSAP
jgi:hypothetical protein